MTWGGNRANNSSFCDISNQSAPSNLVICKLNEFKSHVPTLLKTFDFNCVQHVCMTCAPYWAQGTKDKVELVPGGRRQGDERQPGKLDRSGVGVARAGRAARAGSHGRRGGALPARSPANRYSLLGRQASKHRLRTLRRTIWLTGLAQQTRLRR